MGPVSVLVFCTLTGESATTAIAGIVNLRLAFLYSQISSPLVKRVAVHRAAWFAELFSAPRHG